MLSTYSLLKTIGTVWSNRACRRIFPTIFGVLCFGILLVNTASAQCVQPTEEGQWRNVDPNTNSLTEIDLRFVCQDQILNGQPYPPGPPWYVHLFGKCSPTDCNWGEVGGQKIAGGYIYAFYDQGFAKRYVYARMSQYRPGQLWVYVWTDFTDPNRPDYELQNWFVKR